MVGGTYLDHSGFADLKEMKKVGSTKDITVVAQFSRSIKNRPTKRYYFERTNRDGPLANDVVEDLRDIDTSDPKALEDFILWASSKFPAKHYMVILWGHGNGADDENIPNATSNPLLLNDGLPDHNVNTRVIYRSSFGKHAIARKGIGIRPSATAFEIDAVDFLDSRKFKKALASAREALGREVDILGMDSCLMSGAEVCYQVRGSARFTVAPEGIGPADGWPYDKILAELVKRPTMKPRELACEIVGKYLASYSDYEDLSVTQAVCDLGKCSALANAVDGLAEALAANLSKCEARKAIMLSRWQAQSYEGTSYVDLYDFCNLLQTNCAQKDIRFACQKLMKTILPKGFVLKSVYQGEAAQYSYGLSIYFPQDEVSRFYERLDFANDTRWVEFLKEYVSRTRRPKRSKR